MIVIHRRERGERREKIFCWFKKKEKDNLTQRRGEHREKTLLV